MNATDPQIFREIDRLLPQSPDAENGVLGSFMLSPREVGSLCVEHGADPEWFHSPGNRTIYALLIGLWSHGRPLDFITVTQLLRNSGDLESCGGAGHITHLFSYLPSAANAGSYIEILRDCWIRRALIVKCHEISERAYSEPDCPLNLVSEAVSIMGAIGSKKERGKTSAREHLLDLYDELSGATEETNCITSGLDRLDALTGKWKRGELVIIAAETKGGKTALALNIVERNIVLRAGSAVIFSLEMSGKQNVERILCSIAKVDGMKLRARNVTEYEMARIRQEGEKISASKLHIVTDARTLPELLARARQFHAMEPLSLIVLDYIQLLGGSAKKGETREREIASISGGMKNLAEELGCVVIALSQLNDDGRLRESRAIGHDANCVLGIENDKEQEGKKFIRVIAQRSGPSGDSIPVAWLPHFCRFDNLYEK